MRILFSTTAGEGHFGPMVPFARSAVDAGHEVAVAAPESFASSIASSGLKHLPVDDVPGHLIGAVMRQLPTLPREEANKLVVGEVFGRLDTQFALPKMRQIFRDFQPDVVLREPAEFASAVAAVETGTRSTIVAIGVDEADGFYRETVRPALRDFGIDDDAEVWDVPQVSLLPASFDSVNNDHIVTRYRDLPAKRVELPDWWSGSDAPLAYVTFGSVAANMGLFPRLYQHAIDQLANLDVRGLLTIGRSADPAALGTLPPNVHVEQWFPQAGALAQAAVAIGHGGFGTTLGALVAGVPSVVMPLFSIDQFINARRVAECGLGFSLDGLESPAADPATAGDLAAAVQEVLTHNEIRERAEKMAAEIATLPLVTDFPATL
ncbi:glycosyltransferase [Smaragdicoccus niigatensis]|uniref:glycosyltransferase n=1 Tax=Smaragdicoccus niigatensis TaxID=359359 RepID=UPI00039B6076|nr:glycosyltransferase [Smaragdicoccus niigatensis]